MSVAPATAGRCARAVRRHRRPQQAQAVPRAVPHGGARPARRAGHRRGAQRLDRRRVPPARARLDPRARSPTRRRRSSRRCSPASTSSRATTPTPKTWSGLAKTLDGHNSEHAVFYMAIPPTMFPTVAAVVGVGRPERARPHRGGEAVRPRPRQRQGAEHDAAHGVPRGAHLPHRPLPRQGERGGPAGVPLLATRCSSRCGTATTCAACRSR